MFAKAKVALDPRNAEGTKRLFVIETLSPRQIAELGEQVLDIFSEVGGHEFSALEIHDKTAHLHAALAPDRFDSWRVRTLALGIPLLRNPAALHGKLEIYGHRLVTPDEHLRAIRFGVFTNDSVDHVIPKASTQLMGEFDEAVKDLADTVYGDISLPMPDCQTGIDYDPTIFCP